MSFLACELVHSLLIALTPKLVVVSVCGCVFNYVFQIIELLYNLFFIISGNSRSTPWGISTLWLGITTLGYI